MSVPSKSTTNNSHSSKPAANTTVGIVSDSTAGASASDPSTSSRPRAAYGQSLERTAVYRRKGRLLEKYLLQNPNDPVFKNLTIPDDLRAPTSKRRKKESDVNNTEENASSNAENDRSEENASAINNIDYFRNTNDSRGSNNNACVNNCDDEIRGSDVVDNGNLAGNTYDDSGTSSSADDVTSSSADDVTSSDEESDRTPNTDTKDGENRMFSIDFENECWTKKIPLKSFVTPLYMITNVIATVVRGKLTYAVMEAMLRSLRLMTVNSGLPGSVKTLWKMLRRNDDTTTTRHLYCQACKKYLGEGTIPKYSCSCGKCGPMMDKRFLSYFIEVKITPQLHQLFVDPAVVKCLRYRFERKKRNPDSMNDMFDATQYRKECEEGGFLENEYNFSFTIFTDGCSVSDSSNASAWPIFLIINEFSPHARKRYVILAGIWVDKVHPDLNMFLLPTIRELRMLHDVGIEWTHPVEKTVITSKFKTLICTVDSVARPMILNMTQFNGEYGCTFCYAEGKTMTSGNKGGHHRIYPVDETAPLRTNIQIREHMMQANATGIPVFGVKGISPLMGLAEFDFGSGVVVDNMHNVYMGVVKGHTKLLLSGKTTDNWYSVSANNITEIDSRLMSLQPPNRISRMPRSIKDRNQWKASEWRNWILYYAVPCLSGMIPERDLFLLSMLSSPVYIFNKDTIRNDELVTAQTLLQRYVAGYQDRYGITNMSYNIHLLTHLPDSVRNWGPFWTHSTFTFESWNKKIIDTVTSANSRPLQIVTRFWMTRFIQGFFNEPKVPLEMKENINLIMTSGSKLRRCAIAGMTMESLLFRPIGRGTNRQPEEWESRVLESAGYKPRRVDFWKKALIMGIDFRTREYKNDTKFCNKYIYCNDNQCGEILQIVQFEHNNTTMNGFLVQFMIADGWAFRTQHIENVKISPEIKFVSIDDAPVPAIFIDVAGQQQHIIRLPNVWETD